MKLGIIVATDEELNEIKKLLIYSKNIKYYNLNFFTGKISNKEVVVVKSGIGKVNAGRTTQILIDKFEVEIVVNIGAAGAINPDLNIKDIVIGEKLVQYDFDISSLGEHQKGEIQDIGIFIESDKKLVQLCKRAIEKDLNRDYNFKIGTIATADIFCSDEKKAKQTRKEFMAECVEMEGAAIAQVCFLDKIPFLVIRGISDTPNGKNKMDYNSYCKIAAKQVSKILEKLIEII